MADKKTPFLVCYDYGTGGLWALLYARSREEIADRYPELVIFDERPVWFEREASWQRLVERGSIDIDEPSRGLLRAIHAGRARP